FLLDQAFQRPGPELRIEPIFRQVIDGIVAEMEADTPFCYQPLQAFQLYPDDPPDLAPEQRLKKNDLIDPIEEFRSYGLSQQVHHFQLGPVHHLRPVLFCDILEIGLYDLAPHIAGHDDDRVLEIDHPALIVRQPSIVQYLQQNIENVRVRLFYLIQKDHTVGFAPDSLRQLPAFIISYVFRRRPDQPAYRMLFLVLAHIDPRHHAFVIEKIFRKGLRELGLADPRSAEEDERSDRTPGILETRPAPAYRIRDRLDGFILPDDAFMQFVLEVQEFFFFALQHLRYGDSRRLCHGLRDVFRIYLFLHKTRPGIHFGQLRGIVVDDPLLFLDLPITDLGYLPILSLPFCFFGRQLQIFDIRLGILYFLHQLFFLFPFRLKGISRYAQVT